METKQLILLRHAKSDWYSLAPRDIDRPLNARGRNNASRVGEWFQGSAYRPERILCSVAERTRETLDRVLSRAGWPDVEIDYRADLYLASATRIIDLLRDNMKVCDRIMVVGHNPGMDEVLLHFCPDIEVEDKLMTTCAFAVIEFENAQLAFPKLIEFHKPRELVLP